MMTRINSHVRIVEVCLRIVRVRDGMTSGHVADEDWPSPAALSPLQISASSHTNLAKIF